jgi:hypothetical protein
LGEADAAWLGWSRARLKGLVSGGLTAVGGSPSSGEEFSDDVRTIAVVGAGAFAGSVESLVIVGLLPAIAAETGVSLAAGRLVKRSIPVCPWG